MKKLAYILPFFLLAFALQPQLQAGENSKPRADKDIVAVALDAGSFTILARALTEAGLVDALQADGPFTVFAPTDRAFEQLPAGTLENLLKDKEALKEILLYHVVSGEVSSKQVVNLDKATTLAGTDLRISVNNGRVMINSAKVTTADVAASNGVIHIIDEVLIPTKTESKKMSSSSGSCN